MKVISFDERNTARDLAKLLDDRLKTLINDYINRCEEIDVSEDAAVVQILTLLGHYMTLAAQRVGANETEYMQICMYHFHLKEHARHG
jgi:hypothetical protein